MKNEIRFTPCSLHIREAAQGEGKEGNSRHVTGYAIRFNEESVVLDDFGMRFTEVIDPSCVTEAYLRECDVKMTLFHNREMLLARSNKGKGSMRLGVDKEGVWFEFDAPNTAEGDKCLEGIRREDLSGCSFTFAPKDYEVEERGKDDYLIRHTSFAWLGEMTIGSDPAYPTTSVNCRELVEQYSKREDEQKEDDEEKKDQDETLDDVAEETGTEETQEPAGEDQTTETDEDEDKEADEKAAQAKRERMVRLYGYMLD